MMIKHLVFSYSSNEYRIYGTYAFLFLFKLDHFDLKWMQIFVFQPPNPLPPPKKVT